MKKNILFIIHIYESTLPFLPTYNYWGKMYRSLHLGEALLKLPMSFLDFWIFIFCGFFCFFFFPILFLIQLILAPCLALVLQRRDRNRTSYPCSFGKEFFPLQWGRGWQLLKWWRGREGSEQACEGKTQASCYCKVTVVVGTLRTRAV